VLRLESNGYSPVDSPCVDEGWITVEVCPPPVGDYRVTVSGPEVAPVTGICTVVAAEQEQDAADSSA
jgi:hypothetical protein